MVINTTSAVIVVVLGIFASFPRSSEKKSILIILVYQKHVASYPRADVARKELYEWSCCALDGLSHHLLLCERDTGDSAADYVVQFSRRNGMMPKVSTRKIHTGCKCNLGQGTWMSTNSGWGAPLQGLVQSWMPPR